MGVLLCLWQLKHPRVRRRSAIYDYFAVGRVDSHALDVVAIHSKGLRVGGSYKLAAAMVLPDNDQAKSLLLAGDVPERIGTHGLTYCTARGGKV
jgi:hypothetical protein